MATQRVLVPTGTTSAAYSVGPLVSVAAGPSLLGGSVLVEFSPNGQTGWRPWGYGTNGTITQGGSLRSDVNGFVRCTATTAPANMFLIDMTGANTPNVTQMAAVNATLASASATTEQVLLSVRVPPGYLTPNFMLEIDLSVALTNNVNVKTLIVKWAGTTIFTVAVTSFLNYNGVIKIAGRGDGSSLLGFGPGASGGIGGSATAYTALSRDYLTQESEITITATKATGTDTFALESALFKLY